MWRAGPSRDSWSAAFAVTAGVTTLLLLAADLYLELIALGAAYAATGLIVSHGKRWDCEETTG